MKRIFLAIILMWSGMSWAQQPQTSVNPLSNLNARYVNGVAPGYWATAGTGLTLNLSSGSTVCATVPTVYAGGTLAMTAATTNYVQLDMSSSCVPMANTTGFISGNVPVAKVVTNGSAITGITDWRPVGTGVACTGCTTNVTNGLGNGVQVVDVSLVAGSDLSVKANACLNSANGVVCDARGITSPTGSVVITTSKTGGTLILPAGSYTLPYGFVPWNYGTIYGAGPGATHTTVTNGDGVYGSASAFKIHDVQIYASASGSHGWNVICFECSVHDVIFQGDMWGFLDPGGNGYFSDSTNILAGCTNVSGCHAFELAGLSNANHFGLVQADDQNNGGTCFVFSGTAYNNLIDHAICEQSGNSQFADFKTGAHHNTIVMADFENDSPPANSSWLSTFESGVNNNYILFGHSVECVDLSGNQTNACPTQALGRLLQTFNPGKFVVSQIATPTLGATSIHSYYATPPAVLLPSGTYFPGSQDYTMEVWIYLPLAYYPWNPSLGSIEFVADIGNPNYKDEVRLGINVNGMTPYLLVSQGGSYQTVAGGTALTLSALNHLVVVWNHTTGKATFYVNGSVDSNGAQAIQAPSNVTRTASVLGTSLGLDPNNGTTLTADIMEFAIYPSALSAGTISTHYTDGTSGAANYPADVTGASPTVYYRLNDLPASITLSAAANTNGTTTVYTGTMPAGCSVSTFLADVSTYISGFTNPGNNSAAGAGPFTIQSCTPTTITVTNPNGVAESAAAVATYPNVAAATAGSNGSYTGAVTLNVDAGIPSYFSGSGKSALLGGKTLWPYYAWATDKNGGMTGVSSVAYAVNFSILDSSNYNTVGPSGSPGVYTYSIMRGAVSNSDCIAQAWLGSQFPLLDGKTTYNVAACSPNYPTRNSTGEFVVSGANFTPADNITCTAGTVWWDTGYIYVCTASGTVKRATLSGY